MRLKRQQSIYAMDAAAAEPREFEFFLETPDKWE
jgi:hypothetical protein